MPSSIVRSVLGERLARQGLGERPAGDAVAATALTTAIQAQDAAAARLGMRARAGDTVSEADVLQAIGGDRTLVRTWLMRGTIHLVTTADLRWLVRLIGPSVTRKYRTRWAQLGLTAELLDRVVAALPEILADGPRTRSEIRAALLDGGVRLDSPDPQIHTHALVHASCLGLVCRGADRGRDATFALLDDWVPTAPEGPSGDDALAELARRYFRAFSPATAADFTTWSGLAARRAIELVRDELEPADVDGRPGYRLGEVRPESGVRLLPAFDNYLIGYRDRAAILDPQRHPLIYRGGLISPAVLVDGQVVGAWSLDRSRGQVRVEPFEAWSTRVQAAVSAEIADVARFLGRELSVEP